MSTDREPASNKEIPTLPDELEDEIRRLKKEQKAVILANYYQESEIQDLADFVVDSLQLSLTSTFSLPGLLVLNIPALA